MAEFVEPASRPAHLPEDTLQRLQALLMAELRGQTERWAEHEATAKELRGQLDLDSALERELAEAAARRARESISDTEHALQRMAAGSYGHCEACGRPIPYERLEAIPHARLCVACLTRHEGSVGSSPELSALS